MTVSLNNPGLKTGVNGEIILLRQRTYKNLLTFCRNTGTIYFLCTTFKYTRLKKRTSLSYLLTELLTKAICLLSGDHDGTLIVPWPPYK